MTDKATPAHALGRGRSPRMKKLRMGIIATDKPVKKPDFPEVVYNRLSV
ncbi:Uncharacterised protein [Mycobacterium tuberculosis]|nr:Uncharacterised protein [Mycobacterium tuberculosis]